MDRPTTLDLIPLLSDLYMLEEHGCGGHLHIVLDDGNLRDADVEFCIAAAAKDGCLPCQQVGALLRVMTETQRRGLYNRHAEYA